MWGRGVGVGEVWGREGGEAREGEGERDREIRRDACVWSNWSKASTNIPEHACVLSDLGQSGAIWGDLERSGATCPPMARALLPAPSQWTGERRWGEGVMGLDAYAYVARADTCVTPLALRES